MRYIRLIASLSFILLITVLFYLTYNTFVLNDRQYQITEKNLLSGLYTGKIKNDNIYPGGSKILSRYLYQQKEQLEAHYDKSSSADNEYAHLVLKRLFSELRAANPMDSIFSGIKKKYQLKPELEYLLTVNSIKISRDDHPVFLFDQNKHYSFLPDKYQSSRGYILGGNLKSPLAQNLISGLTVTSTDGVRSFEVGFSFHADKNDRNWQIFKATVPAFVLALLASLSVLLIYYITYRNWIRVKRLAEMKTDFVDSITHEFHTPIATIMVANKSLQNDRVLADADKVKSLSNVIFRQSRRLELLFGQVLDIARLDHVTLEKSHEMLNELVEEIVDDYRLKAEVEDVRIYLSTIPGDVKVSLNRFWFTTMLFNIFDNAVKYNDKPEKLINVEMVQHKGEVLLRISDNGVGMDREMVTYIFEKFYRVQRKELDHIPGLGLGLYYAQQCVRAHGWKMEVKSEVNTGTEFSIFIS